MFRKFLFTICLGLPVPTMAEVEPLSAPDHQVQAFIVVIPPLEEVPFAANTNHVGVSTPVHREHMTYHFRRADVLAHSFIRDRNRRDRRGEELGDAAIGRFAQVCAEQGGYLESEAGRPFEATLRHLFNDTYHMQWQQGLNPADPVFELAVCSASPERALAALTVTRDRLTYQTAIVLFAPSAVVTRADLDRRRAAMEAEGRREMAERQREVDRLPSWRDSISQGTETACGPILNTNGDLIEVVDPGTRQPRWYRRGELSPAYHHNGQPNTCRQASNAGGSQ